MFHSQYNYSSRKSVESPSFRDKERKQPKRWNVRNAGKNFDYWHETHFHYILIPNSPPPPVKTFRKHAKVINCILKISLLFKQCATILILALYYYVQNQKKMFILRASYYHNAMPASQTKEPSRHIPIHAINVLCLVRHKVKQGVKRRFILIFRK